MSNRGQNPRYGQEAADRFREANFLPRETSESKARYLQRRLAAYPGLPPKDLAPEHEDARRTYKVPQDENTTAFNHYWSVHDQEQRLVNEAEEYRKDYYKYHSAGIEPRGHSRLIPLARDWSEKELAHAEAREAAISQHPFMYQTLRGAREHHGHVETHYKDSDRAYVLEQEHRRYATPFCHPGDTRPGDRDLYNNVPSRGTLPYGEPYPPTFPPEGYYATTRGEEQEFDGEGFTEVTSDKSSRRGRRRRAA